MDLGHFIGTTHPMLMVLVGSQVYTLDKTVGSENMFECVNDTCAKCASSGVSVFVFVTDMILFSWMDFALT